MPLISSNGRHRKRATIGLAAVMGVVGIAAAAIAFSSGDSQATEDCGGLDTALQNNLTFIAGQQANPDAQSEARIANRQAVVDLIQSRRQAAGCNANVVAGAAAAKSGEDCDGLDTALQNNLNFIAGQEANPDSQSAARIANRQAVVDLIESRREAAGCAGTAGANQPPANNGGGAKPPVATPPATSTAAQPPANNAGGGNAGGGAAGEVVCAGSTVTLSGEDGAPAASSGTLPVGTKIKVTNLDNNKATTVEVTGVSGSCTLLNNAAFEQVREPGKFLIRQARIERVG